MKAPRPFRVLVAPDSFKGTYTAHEVAYAIAAGLATEGLATDCCPVADGGEGTANALIAALGGERLIVPTSDALGRAINGEVSLLNGGRVAIVETAAASGLERLLPTERDPWVATTWGTGRLIRAAVETGARTVLVALGGSATVDGGQGAVDAIRDGGGLGGVSLIALCDVSTPWETCAEIYGPQKGADSELVERLARRLDRYARSLTRDPRGAPMTGAAGGLAGGLWAALDATLVPGARYVLDSIGFDDRLRGAAAVVTGEGQIDEQSTMGKIIGEIGLRARAAGVPVHAIVGQNALDDANRPVGLCSVAEAPTLSDVVHAGTRLARTMFRCEG